MITNPRLLGELALFTPHRQWYKSQNFSTVIDVGGFVSSFSYAIHILTPKSLIFCFEPIVGNHRKLMNNMSGVSNFRAFNLALGDKCGTRDFFINKFSPASSVMQMEELHIKNYPHTKEY